jgi:ketosteroid isomerase-like protein
MPYRDSGQRWSAYETELIEAVFAGGDIVVAEGEVRATGRASGIETRRRFGYLFRISEGRIIRFEIFGSRAEAFEAGGLEE